MDVLSAVGAVSIGFRGKPLLPFNFRVVGFLGGELVLEGLGFGVPVLEHVLPVLENVVLLSAGHNFITIF